MIKKKTLLSIVVLKIIISSKIIFHFNIFKVNNFIKDIDVMNKYLESYLDKNFRYFIQKEFNCHYFKENNSELILTISFIHLNNYYLIYHNDF